MNGLKDNLRHLLPSPFGRLVPGRTLRYCQVAQGPAVAGTVAQDKNTLVTVAKPILPIHRAQCIIETDFLLPWKAMWLERTTPFLNPPPGYDHAVLLNASFF